jgi:hypothetical protein
MQIVRKSIEKATYCMIPTMDILERAKLVTVKDQYLPETSGEGGMRE